MKLFIDAVAIRGGGGATVLANMLQGFRAIAPTMDVVVFGAHDTRRTLGQNIGPASGWWFRFTVVAGASNYLVRLGWQQFGLPLLCRLRRADCVLCLGNVGALLPTISQFVYFHNALYLSPEHFPAGGPGSRLRIRSQWTIIKWSLRRARRVIAQTQAVAAELVRQVHIPASRIAVIPPGVLQLGPNGAAKDAAALTTGRPRLLYVTHPAPHKNVETLLHAVAQLRESIPDVQLVLTIECGAIDHKNVVGDPATYRNYVQGYLQLVSALGLDDSVTWVGILSPGEVRASIRACTVFCFPSLVESFPQPLLEAMVLGAPIIAADRPYAREICGEAALYADPFRPESWCECIEAMIKDDALRRRLGEAGIRRSQRYSYRHAAEQVLALLAERGAAQG